MIYHINTIKRGTSLIAPIVLNKVIKRFHPISGPTYMMTEKFARRILSTFYHGHVSKGLHFEAKIRLPDEQAMIHSFREYTGFYKDKQSSLEAVRTIWKNRGTMFIDSNIFKDNENIFAHVTTISKFMRAISMPSNDIINKILEEHQTKLKASEQDNQKKKEKLTTQQKIAFAVEERNNILELFHRLEEKLISDKILDEDILKQIETYIDNRGSILSLSSEEHTMFTSLTRIFKENYSSRDHFVPSIDKKDNLDKYKQDLTIDKSIFVEEPIIHCTEQEYQTTMESLEKIKDLLQSKQYFTVSDLITLAYHSKCVNIDEQGNPKFSPEAYKYIFQESNPLGVKYTNENPDVNQILTALKKRCYVICQESLNTSENRNVKMFSSLHKTLRIFLDDGTVLETSMLTSTDGKNMSLHIGYQEINQDPKNIMKEEYFYIFPHFIKVNPSESIKIDSVAQGFIQSKNLQGEDIEKMIYDFFVKTAEFWGNRSIMEPFEITDNVLRNLASAFYNDKLESVKKQYNKYLEYIKDFNSEQLKDYEQNLLAEKDSILEIKNRDKYISSLPSNGKLLLRCIKKFEYIKEQENIQAEFKKKKQEQEEALKKHNESRSKEGRLRTKEQRKEILEKRREDRQASKQSEQQNSSLTTT